MFCNSCDFSLLYVLSEKEFARIMKLRFCTMYPHTQSVKIPWQVNNLSRYCSWNAVDQSWNRALLQGSKSDLSQYKHSGLNLIQSTLKPSSGPFFYIGAKRMLDTIFIYRILRALWRGPGGSAKIEIKLLQTGKDRNFGATARQIHWPANMDSSRRYNNEEGCLTRLSFIFIFVCTRTRLLRHKFCTAKVLVPIFYCRFRYFC